MLTAAQDQSLTFGASGTQTVDFNPFDTSLGTLQAVVVTVTAQIVDPDFIVQDDEAVPASAQVSLVSMVSVATANETLAAPGLMDSGTVTLTQGGPAGDQELSGSAAFSAGGTPAVTNTVILPATDPDRALFTGSGSVPLSVLDDLTALYSGPGGAFITSSDTAGVQLSLQYDYTPPGTPIATGGGSGGGTTITNTPTLTPVTVTFPAGSVTTAPQTVTLPDQSISWSDSTHTVQRFDASLGRLEAVDITLTADGNASALTMDAAPSGSTALSLSRSETVSLALPGSTPLTAGPSATASPTIAAGQTQTYQQLPTAESNSVTLTDTTDLAAFTGTGAIALPLSATSAASLTLPNDQDTALTAEAGATVAVSYTYLPAAAECFAAGTRIAAPDGERAVEDLREGDDVMTAAGGVARVVWVGRRRVDCRRHPRPREVWPVRVRAHAFGEDVPRRDVLLSPDHAVFMEGVLIPVRRLIDGAAVAQVPAEAVTYFHVELERHDVLLADGLPAESYLDVGARAAFADGGAAAPPAPGFAGRVREAAGCAPLAVVGREVERVRARLAAWAFAAAA
jgi:hypothetical protein